MANNGPSDFIIYFLLPAHIEPAKEAAGYRHAWWLKSGSIARREGAMLGIAPALVPTHSYQHKGFAIEFSQLGLAAGMITTGFTF
jgi:hypothetical protein